MPTHTVTPMTEAIFAEVIQPSITKCSPQTMAAYLAKYPEAQNVGISRNDTGQIVDIYYPNQRRATIGGFEPWTDQQRIDYLNRLLGEARTAANEYCKLAKTNRERADALQSFIDTHAWS